ncbi:CHC2 zinc finger domain-containing protein [Cyanobium sp. FGCU-52]|nr:CHC2 zinc finger domain-containing protein [Cyanobium sp. FGCU52]
MSQQARGPTGGLPAEWIENVRQRARITDLFGQQELRKAGRDFLAHCPWHDDRRPSLTVSPQRNRVHCFVCRRGCDPIGWLQDRQGLTFIEAVQELAERYGIPRPAADPEAEQRLEAERREREHLRAQRAEQQQRFHQALLKDLEAGGPAAAYLQARGLTSDTARAWGLGVAGQRLMLPLCDAQGRCCGFAGRAIGDQEPRYRNTKADVLFRRSELLFGLHHAAAAIRRHEAVLLVEGPLDVIQLHQGGIENVVAALGTALTPEQRQRLERLGARRLILAFDGDEAGRKATAQVIQDLRPMVIAGSLELAVLDLPAGSDPDSLVRREGPNAFRQWIDRASHWLHWELEQLLEPARAAPEDLAVLQRCERQAAALLALLPIGPLRRRAEERLQQQLGAVPRAPAPAAPTRETDLASPEGEAVMRAERRALRLFLASPASRPALVGLALQTPLHRRALECLQVLHQRLPEGEETQEPGDLLPAAALALAPRLDPELGGLLEELSQCGNRVRQLLADDPEPELMAVLDVLEPVGSTSVDRT